MDITCRRKDRMIRLKGAEPIASGRMRLVYAHPTEPDLIIKVIRPDVIDERWGEGMRWYKFKRRHGVYVSYLREIGEYLALYNSCGGAPYFTQKVVGLTETDLGLGLVLEAVLDRNGQLAPTLSTLLNQGRFDATASAALEKFFVQLVESDMIIADLHGGNLVYTWTPEHGDHFVMIDGLGLATIMPFKAFLQSTNRRSKLKRIARLRARMTGTRK